MLFLRSVSISCLVLLAVQTSRGSEIIGGKEVKPHSLPYMALLSGKKGACGGVLIDPQWVLTAAHCKGLTKVLLGVHSITKRGKDQWQIKTVKTQVPHSGYNNKSKVNDIMLLKLDSLVKQTDTVKCLQLGKTIKDPAAGSSCLVAGWGLTSNKAKLLSDVLMSVNVTVIDRNKCNSRSYYNRRPVITSDMICAGSTQRMKRADTCRGDSGGPLLCNEGLAGITSFGGKKCGDRTKPGVYSFLSEKQLKWIKKKMNGY